MSTFNAYRVKDGKVSKISAIVGAEKDVLEDYSLWLLEYLNDSGGMVQLQSNHPVKSKDVAGMLAELVTLSLPKPEPKPEPKPVRKYPEMKKSE